MIRDEMKIPESARSEPTNFFLDLSEIIGLMTGEQRRTDATASELFRRLNVIIDHAADFLNMQEAVGPALLQRKIRENRGDPFLRESAPGAEHFALANWQPSGAATRQSFDEMLLSSI
ncbi:MAG: hypothetical protein NC924_09150 [Candidatus Omnitrophica bacterium]|nr:hypothetical protein [Candidatus Omnitrophota bacterium]